MIMASRGYNLAHTIFIRRDTGSIYVACNVRYSSFHHRFFPYVATRRGAHFQLPASKTLSWPTASSVGIATAWLKLMNDVMVAAAVIRAKVIPRAEATFKSFTVIVSPPRGNEDERTVVWYNPTKK
jgi:hypothetical protein